MITVTFVYRTGCPGKLFRHARLQGSWNGWTDLPMTEIVADDGCPAFTRIVELDDDQAGRTVRWGVRLDGPPGPDRWGIPAELPDPESLECQREFRVPPPGSAVEQHYYFTWSRRLGAQKHYAGPGHGYPLLPMGAERAGSLRRLRTPGPRLHLVGRNRPGPGNEPD